MSTCFLNTSRDGDSTTSLGSLFQCLTTLSVKKFFLIYSLNLPWRNLRLLPLVLLLVTREKRPTPASLQPPFRIAILNIISIYILTFILPNGKKTCLKKFFCKLTHSRTNGLSANYIVVDINNHWGSTQLQKQRLPAHQIRYRNGGGVKKQLSLASDFSLCADFSVSIFASYAFLL